MFYFAKRWVTGSQKTATAYEEWLSLDAGQVVVIPNAIPAILPDGDETDQAFWYSASASWAAASIITIDQANEIEGLELLRP